MLNRVIAKFRPRGRRVLRESDDFIVDNNRINVADAEVFRRDPVNLIRLFHLAQRHGVILHPDAMRAATRSLKLVDKTLREDGEANRLFLSILTANHSRNSDALFFRVATQHADGPNVFFNVATI